jgi:hypothetical protein
MSTWIAGFIALAAVTGTYFLCIRPHLRGRSCAITSRSTQQADLGRQVAALREELRVLRAQDTLESGQMRSNKRKAQ